jgi:hypothetical protein
VPSGFGIIPPEQVKSICVASVVVQDEIGDFRLMGNAGRTPALGVPKAFHQGYSNTCLGALVGTPVSFTCQAAPKKEQAMKRILYVLAWLVCFGTAAYAIYQNHKTEEKLSLSRDEYSDLQKQIEFKSAEIGTLDGRTAAMNSVLETFVAEMPSNYRSAELDATEKAFTRVDSAFGPLFVVCEGAEPYLDGYKVHLKIGNPSSATYKGVSMFISWATAKPEVNKPEFVNWSKSIHKKLFEFPDPIQPGDWNKIDVILSPAKPEELRYIEIADVGIKVASLLNVLPTRPQ